jgi:hypothetical protein
MHRTRGRAGSGRPRDEAAERLSPQAACPLPPRGPPVRRGKVVQMDAAMLGAGSAVGDNASGFRPRNRRPSISKGAHDKTSTRARAGATRAAEPRIRLRRRSPDGGEGTNVSCCFSGTGAPLVDVGVTRERTGRRQFRPRAWPGGQTVYRPIAEGEILRTSPSFASTVRGRR